MFLLYLNLASYIFTISWVIIIKIIFSFGQIIVSYNFFLSTVHIQIPITLVKLVDNHPIVLCDGPTWCTVVVQAMVPVFIYGLDVSCQLLSLVSLASWPLGSRSNLEGTPTTTTTTNDKYWLMEKRSDCPQSLILIIKKLERSLKETNWKKKWKKRLLVDTCLYLFFP